MVVDFARDIETTPDIRFEPPLNARHCLMFRLIDQYGKKPRPPISLECASLSRGLVPPIGNKCANAISKREPAQQANCKNDF